MPKRALITGITGQDGSYLAEFLLEQGYQVYGTIRRTSTCSHERICHIEDRIKLISADLLDQSSLTEALEYSHADEVYNLASMSSIDVSFRQPITSAEITGLAVTRMLEAVRRAEWQIRFFQASSAEIFGNSPIYPQNELTPYHPRNPYGAAKLYGHSMTVNYRESYNLFACNGILFNHESPRRGLEFVTRKIAHSVARIRYGLQHKLVLGNLEARRDWGYAPEYVKAMWLMLQQDAPDDYVIATGVTHSVSDFVALAFAYAGIDEWQEYVEICPEQKRPSDIELLIGDASKAQNILHWSPTVTFQELVEIMVKSELQDISKQVFQKRYIEKDLYEDAAIV